MSKSKTKADYMNLKALLDEAWPAHARKTAVMKLAREANKGTPWAMKMLFEYAFGRPKEMLEISGKLQHEMTARDYTDDELRAIIARGSSNGVAHPK